MTNQRIGQYELLGPLGEGGIGQVYVGRDTVLGRQAAIKTLRPEYARDRNFLDRFFAEAQSLANLSHTNVATLYGFQADGPQPFMAMELVRGHTLAALLARLGRVPVRESLAITAQAAAGLAYAHGEGVIHRDIKPENLMITERGVLKIMDFGIARVRGSKRLTRAGQIFGTLLYASPEQIRGAEVDERSDLYSLAVVLHEMLAGTPPFSLENEHALMTAHLEAPPPPLSERLPGVTAELRAAVLKALAKRPEDRFPTVEAFARAAGTAAVRGEESEILQQLIATAFRDTRPPATRFITTADPTASRSRGSQSGGSTPSPMTELRPSGGPSSLRGPALILGAAVIGLGVGVGYVLLVPKSEPIPAPPRVAALEPPPPALPPAPATPKVEPPPTASSPSTVMIEPPKPEPSETQPPPESPAGGDTPVPGGRPPATPALPPSPPEPVSLPPAPEPITPPPPSPAITESPQQPDLAGTVQSISGASKFKVAGQLIELWGVDDVTRRGEHIPTVYSYLKPYKGVVQCYHKEGDRYQCYSGGNDLAIMALRHGLARLTADAPAEYRALTSRPASIRE